MTFQPFLENNKGFTTRKFAAHEVHEEICVLLDPDDKIDSRRLQKQITNDFDQVSHSLIDSFKLNEMKNFQM